MDDARVLIGPGIKSISWEQEVVCLVPGFFPGIGIQRVTVVRPGKLRLEIVSELLPTSRETFFRDRVGSVFESDGNECGWYTPFVEKWTRYRLEPDAVEEPPYPTGTGALPHVTDLVAQLSSFPRDWEFKAMDSGKDGVVRVQWKSEKPRSVHGLIVSTVERTYHETPRYPIREVAYDAKGEKMWDSTFSDPHEVAPGIWSCMRCETECQPGSIPGHFKMHSNGGYRIKFTDEGKVVKEDIPEGDVVISEPVSLPGRKVVSEYFWHEKGVLLPRSVRHYVDQRLVLAIHCYDFRVTNER